MDAWTTLGLTPTADTKLIKKAYAVLLKQNKPDENPAGFAQLHSAYKECLAEAKYAAYQASCDDDDEPAPTSAAETLDREIILVVNSQPTNTHQEHADLINNASEALLTEPQPQSHAVLNSPYCENNNAKQDVPAAENNTAIIEPLTPADTTATDDDDRDDAENQRINAAKEYLIENTQTALEVMLSRDDITAWAFIEDCDDLYDLELKNGFNRYLMGQWVEFFENEKITAKQRKQSLIILNNYFDWISQELDFDDDYSYAQIAPIFAVLHSQQEQAIKWLVTKNHSGPLVHGNYYARLAATFLDWVMFGITVASLSFIDFTAAAIIIAILSHFLINAVLEASPMQGSLGKILFGLKVTSSKGRRINIFHSCWRQLLFVVSTVGVKITMWINMFMSNGNLLHDQLSYTRVIKR